MTDPIFPFAKTQDLEHLTEVVDHFKDQTVKLDVKALNKSYLLDRVPNCVAFAVYSSLRFSGILPQLTGSEVADAFRTNGEKNQDGFSNLDIRLLIEALTNREYTTSLIGHADYQNHRLEIEKRSSSLTI